MAKLAGKKIILGITGSIAAYKAAHLTRLLIKAGAEVQVLMTPSATDFISPLSLATLSKRKVFTEVSSGAAWNQHVDLGLWADALVVAPATANTLAKLANGLCDNILSAVYLSARCPVFLAPAMDVDMWHHPSTQANLARLQSYGNHLIPVEYGELASGLVGEGRLAEPETILDFLATHLQPATKLSGKTVLLTAGPTYEPLDPVRFIGNRSSGKMGLALAQAILARGGKVQLILGPHQLQLPTHPQLEVVAVQTAQEMYQATTARFAGADVAIMAAAVADYRPQAVAPQKIKKKGQELQITLVKNPDIAAELGRRKQQGQLLVGFALETHDAAAHARAKLQRKRLDLIVLNSLQDPGAGFGLDTNKITIFTADNKVHEFELKSKQAVAYDILDVVQAYLPEK
ncbi:MAG: bifunctional phosphopantothenoylcysteine decarboxylase/phosphopantothenate--cysteine ligase CoaBC [Bacteroidetes bacterium]|nr:MAG: bifunctional phosphopantothenoylcysteine decarboxylase/phosphopantothenate--cysteine ligase CoaBC [Bacteroidota bacterium]